ncbi:hypothetical protein MP638_000688 [Amoeboaphelidium occidentale]|nr:hypothetical protein MP638_000688 [Amoeboaphelidium occidentale]
MLWKWLQRFGFKEPESANDEAETKDELKEFPKFLETKATTEDIGICNMCQMKIGRVKVQPCGHGFCELCFEDEKKSTSCPSCETDIEHFELVSEGNTSMASIDHDSVLCDTPNATEPSSSPEQDSMMTILVPIQIVSLSRKARHMKGRTLDRIPSVSRAYAEQQEELICFGEQKNVLTVHSRSYSLPAALREYENADE